MSKRRHYGKCVRLGRTHLTMGRCETCGTYNPAMPGKPKPDTCAGCGEDLPRDETTVKPTDLTRKKGRPDLGRSDGD